MDELKFKVSTGLKSILGQDLITSDNIAILELVKNSYDAHATRVIITFEKDSIIIADNGKGMSLNDLQNKWLFVGYSAKSDGTEDASYRSKFKRNFAGAKGIGRISCDRLGSEVWLTTKSEDSNTVEVIHVDWNKFEKSLKNEFDKVSVDHESREDKFTFPGESLIGTEIRITGFRPETPEWTRERITDLKKSLEKMINPFSGTEDFCIEIKAKAFEKEDHKILAKIENSRDEFTEERIAKLKNSIVNGVIQNTISDVLTIKTTLIESCLVNGIITTKLLDRGEAMYEIQEVNQFDKLENVTINLYFLNQSAKRTFTLRMGIPPIQYGSVMLFRNGFRIWPYGEEGDDSWKLDRRAQQGIRRFLGTRSLFGRVNVETSDVSAFKEVSSRDGGLIMTEAAKQLMDFFSLIHRRLERYVVGVLWGEGFIRNEYFKSQDFALKAREMLKNTENYSDTSENLYSNIGSKVDFLQLIKSLVNDKNVVIKQYNTKLADVVSDVTYADVLQTDFVESLKDIAIKTSDESLEEQIIIFERRLEQIRKEKEEAEKKAEEERLAKIKAERKAEKERKAKEKAEQEAQLEREAKEKAEKELEAKTQQNLYLSSTQDTSADAKDFMHAIKLSATELDSVLNTTSKKIRKNTITTDAILVNLDEMAFRTNEILQISRLLTMADVAILSKDTEIDIQEFVIEYLMKFQSKLKITIGNKYANNKKKLISALALSVVIDNLKDNSEKADATELVVDFYTDDNIIQVLFTDNGKGVDLVKYTQDSIFEPGVTNRRGGSGIGLYTIRTFMKRYLNGEIQFSGNGLRFETGATFKLIFI